MAESVRAVDAAVEILQDRGVRYAFGVPGESFLGLLDALSQTPMIDLISTRHEGGAAFMADATAKLTGQPAICMGTRGVGTGNLAVGIHTAQQDSTPMIAMVGQVETPARHREALQEVELAQFLGPITKNAIEPPDGSTLPRIMSEAHRLATTGRPGPVAIALRGDILDEQIPIETYPASANPMSALSPDLASSIVALLASASQPLIIAGGGILRSNATQALVAFAETTQIQVLTAFRRMDAFPTDHALSLGSLSFGTPGVVGDRARNADVVLAIGTRLSEVTTLGYTVPSAGAKLIQIDISADNLGKTFPAAISAIADAGLALQSLLLAAEHQNWPDRTSANQSDRDAYLSAVESASAEPVDLVNPATVVREFARRLPEDSVITSDAGNFFSWVQRFSRFNRPGTFLGPTSGAMGYAVPAAVAAAIVRDNRVPVVATCGDGGFLMTANELATAAALGRNVICCVFNNALYGTIRLHQARTYPGHVAGTEIWSPDFVKYAEAFGGIGIRVESDADVPEAVATALRHEGIVVLDIAVSRETIAPGVRLGEVDNQG